jgi:hypothetical protein
MMYKGIEVRFHTLILGLAVHDWSRGHFKPRENESPSTHWMRKEVMVDLKT